MGLTLVHWIGNRLGRLMRRVERNIQSQRL